ncbi:MAG: glycosyl transferase [Candidatus Nephthysia bennettiae]|uniref:Glycosyltransferase family 39 protein n=1 Tax=Candidatus Nephthysia bennettiae TaxID=3127016 RepID=A0A934KCK8_9BACT|nr:glycosyltransferase family 39 protein [Candidatus Dormibacteraeota bacterium]MBJ7612071.1 glycosyltransferase family 39 protein [Candidatus Dormibacteraeota bacterium]PZR91950.1 MAG: glycosyl transferase [Candidatus Dormibacteraeota bacterium]
MSDARPAQRGLQPAAAAEIPLRRPPTAQAGERLRRRALAAQDNPAWARPALLVLLSATALGFLWNLSASSWANSFYSAAVQAGTRSWKAFFFGSLDASNFITIDKSPAALWVMEISARVFGVNSWSILVPQALEGVATVGILYLAVRRWFGPGAGLLASGILTLTPVAALMFRFNNPDALLVLLLTGATYAALRALEGGRTGWIVLSGSLIGTAFLTKMLQAFLIVPVLLGVYLIAGPPRLGRRLWQLALGGATLVVASGWWVAIVELTPAANRPYIGGSQTNGVLELVLGYNGFGRLTGSESGSVGGFGATASRWGPTGWDRLFNTQFGGQISWLIPAALVLLGAGLWLVRGRPRTDLTRAALLVWGGTLIVTGAVFSFAQGIIHPYYTVALAPAIGAVVAIGVALLWARRSVLWARLALSAALAGTSLWAFVLLDRTPQWYPQLKIGVLLAGLAAAALVVVVPRAWKRATVAVAVVGLVAALAAPAAYTLATVRTAHTGAIPSAGPAVAAGFGFGGGGNPGAPPGGLAGQRGFGGVRNGAAGSPGAVAGAGAPATPRMGGGFLDSSQPGSALVALLGSHASSYTWVAATVDANNAAGYQLATGDPVMAIGGFNGTDPAPSLAQFQTYVHDGKVHYFIAGGRGGASGSTSATQITSWVHSHFSSQTVDGVTVYDLTQATSQG